MSLPAVLAAVESLGAAVAGVQGHSQGASTPAIPWSETPYWSVEWDGTWQEVFVTFDMIERRYGVRGTLTLGSENLRPADALSQGAGFLDRFRAAFSADPTLGGRVTQAFLDTGSHNLLTYFTADPAEPPLIEWILHVTEHVLASAASQT